MHFLREEGGNGELLGQVSLPGVRRGDHHQVREVQETGEQIQVPEVRLRGSLIGDCMGDVIIVYKILPASPEKFGHVKAGLENLNPKRLEEEPIGFGLSALKFTTIIPDAGGKQDELEEKIRSIDGVGEIEVLRASRSM